MTTDQVSAPSPAGQVRTIDPDDRRRAIELATACIAAYDENPAGADSEPYPLTDLALLGRAFLAEIASSDAQAIAELQDFATYKKRRNEQFAAYERQRHATIALLLVRARLTDSGGIRGCIDELIGDIAEWRHVTNAEAGAYDEVKDLVDSIIVSHLPATTVPPGAEP